MTATRKEIVRQVLVAILSGELPMPSSLTVSDGVEYQQVHAGVASPAEVQAWADWARPANPPVLVAAEHAGQLQTSFSSIWLGDSSWTVSAYCITDLPDAPEATEAGAL